MIITSSSQKTFYRENLRRYFDTPEPDCIVYLYNIVCMLMPTREATEKVRKSLTDTEYFRIQDSIKKFQRLYSYAAQVRRLISEIKQKQAEDRPSSVVELLRKELFVVCKEMPLIRADIISLFFLLVNDSDLRNIVEPVSEKSQALRPYTPYQQSGLA